MKKNNLIKLVLFVIGLFFYSNSFAQTNDENLPDCGSTYIFNCGLDGVDITPNASCIDCSCDPFLCPRDPYIYPEEDPCVIDPCSCIPLLCGGASSGGEASPGPDPDPDPDPEDDNKCKNRTGLLHDANFSNKTPSTGNHITTAEDNFRNDSWGKVEETNCGSGRIPKGSTVKVTSTTPVVRTLSSGKKLNYFRVEYDECLDNNKEKLNCGGDPCKVTSSYGPNAKSESVNDCSLEKIKEIADRLGIKEFEISSTARNAKNQARIMFNNIVAFGVANQKSLYGPNGDKVIDAYSTAKAKKGNTSTSIKKAMEDKINELGPGNVSKHSADSSILTVVDIKPSTIPSNKRAKFVSAVERAVKNGDASRFLHPGNSTDPAYHIEIKVKDCVLKTCN